MRNKNRTSPARRLQMLEYNRLHMSEILKYQAWYKAVKAKEDPIFREARRIRGSINYYFRLDKGWPDTHELMGLVGCTYETYLAYIESSWTEGMSWENYGKERGCWSIDHKESTGSARSIEEVRSRFFFKNVQAMWAPDNVKKSNF